MGAGHDENFPVASLLLPRRWRAPVRALYRFARYADDIADEGDAPPQVRLQRLAQLRAQLDALERGAPTEWPDLAAAVREHDLPVAPLRDLLSAFEQDIHVTRYDDYDALLDYCRRSANPVGRLLLALYRRHEARLATWSDAICTGLQLVNFWQDIDSDYARGRVYLPRSELARFGLDETAIAERRADAAWRALLAAQTARARALLESGRPLAPALGGRVGLELKLVIEGGLRIAERIDAVGGDVFRRRPRLRAPDWLLLAVRATVAAPAGRITP